MIPVSITTHHATQSAARPSQSPAQASRSEQATHERKRTRKIVPVVPEEVPGRAPLKIQQPGRVQSQRSLPEEMYANKGDLQESADLAVDSAVGGAAVGYRIAFTPNKRTHLSWQIM